MTVKAFEAVARENGTERGRHRNTAFGVQAEHVVGHKAVHCAARPILEVLGENGLSWDNMGVNGAAP